MTNKNVFVQIKQFVEKMYYGISKFILFIKRLFRWIPVLWKQEEWDSDCIYDVMKVKLNELRECLVEDDWHVDAPIRVREIDICLKYLDRFQNTEKYIPIPHGECWIADHRIESTQNYSNAVAKNYEFEQGSKAKFWKRFVQWHHMWYT